MGGRRDGGGESNQRRERSGRKTTKPSETTRENEIGLRRTFDDEPETKESNTERISFPVSDSE
jgi:hypothetical protein